MAELSAAIQKAKEIAARLAASRKATGSAPSPAASLGKRKSRFSDAPGDQPPPQMSRPNNSFQWGSGRGQESSQHQRKIYFPVDKHPGVNFLGLIIGPKGATQKALQEESGARILVRGRGASKNDEDANDDMHVLIQAETEARLESATRLVEEIVFNPEKAMELKRAQLSKLNGSGTSAILPDSGMRAAGGLIDRLTAGGEGAMAVGGEGDLSTVVLTIPQDMVGLVIGKGGETIRDLQAASSAHIQIQRDTEAAPGTRGREVTITGTEQTISDAKRMINNLIEDRRREMAGGFAGGVELPVPVDNDRVGLVIGRGGATIKGIQERTGTNIQIPREPDENDPRTRTIVIHAQDDKAAKRARHEIYTLLSDGIIPSAVPEGSVAQQMPVPNDKIGLVIGRQGATIKEIQERTQTRIQIPREPDPNIFPPIRTITLYGAPDCIERAKMEIHGVIRRQQEEQAASRGGYGGGGGGGDEWYKQQQQNWEQQERAQQWSQYYQQVAAWQQHQAAVQQQQQQQQPAAAAAGGAQAAEGGGEAAPGTATDTSATAAASADGAQQQQQGQAGGDYSAEWAAYFAANPEAYAQYYGQQAAQQQPTADAAAATPAAPAESAPGEGQ